ncbi:cell division protein ZapA [candidate division KSB1 bacterium]|nr:cell division protein ZapA [candidate division KSB1 bacterium]
MSEYSVLKVKIYGTEYPIKGDSELEYIKQVAEYVDLKMREVNKLAPEVSTLKVAILAALNIADELFKERLNSEKLEMTDFEDKIRRWINLLENVSEPTNEINRQ